MDTLRSELTMIEAEKESPERRDHSQNAPTCNDENVLDRRVRERKGDIQRKQKGHKSVHEVLDWYAVTRQIVVKDFKNTGDREGQKVHLATALSSV
jgi:hypothetical protein